MANWTRQIDVRNLWEEGDVVKLSNSISIQLSGLKPLEDESLEDRRLDLAADFKSLAEDGMSATVGEFDYMMQELYDWGDERLDDTWNGKKVCWVATNF